MGSRRSRLECLADLFRDIERILDRDWFLLQMAPERFPINVFKHKKPCPVRFVEAMYGGDDHKRGGVRGEKLAEFRWAIGLPEPTVAPNAQPTRRAPGGAIQTGGPTLIRVTSRLSRAGSAPMARNMCRNTVDGCDLPRPVSSPH